MTTLDTAVTERPRSLPGWGVIARTAATEVPDTAVDAYWRALNYLSAAQLYLADNPLLSTPPAPSDVKPTPRGHWGVCPPVNYLLAHLGPITARTPSGAELLVVHGAGHAGPSALAHAYLNGHLRLTDKGPGWDAAELRALVAGFPHEERFGGEITPLITGVRHTGGQLGPALAVAQGMAMDAPHRLVVPLIGDGELETGAAAAAWIARRALTDSGPHGTVLPVVLANGMRMGGPSLLSGMAADELQAYFTGLGYTPLVHDGSDLPGFRRLLGDAFDRVRPLHEPGSQPVIVLTMAKGHTGPEHVAGRRIIGTPAVHKTPLRDPRDNADEFKALAAWLTSYRPAELLTSTGRPTALVRQALAGNPHVPPPAVPWPLAQGTQGLRDVSAVLRERATSGGFKLLCPDEVLSNRLCLSTNDMPAPWSVEILNEEICHGWLQGYTETGRDAVLATYEAFAPINTSLLAQHLKHRRLRYATGDGGLPSINYLITSLAWRNTYTHQNPGLVSSMLETGDGFVHVFTPADAGRAAAVLAAMLASRDRVNFLVTDKHPGPAFPTGPFPEELATGAAVWPHLSHRGPADLVLASAGDVAARELTTAATALRRSHPKARIRYVHVNDLTALGPACTWPSALEEVTFSRLFGNTNPVLMAVPTFPGAVRALLAARGDSARFHVVGYREPKRPTTAHGLLEHSGLSAAALHRRAEQLLGGEPR